MQDVVLGDLLAWEPRIEWLREPAPNWRERDVSWAVIARASPPLLAPLRGGEVVIVPPSGLEWSGSSLPNLLRVLAPHRPAAVILDGAATLADQTDDDDIPLLAMPDAALTAELESALNRLLAERRGELYRAGTELGRTLTSLSGRRAPVGLLADAAAATINAPVRVFDRSGRVVAQAAPPSGVEPAASWAREERPLATGWRLEIGPAAPARLAGARLLADRVAFAMNEAVLRDADLRPRGAARDEALATLLAADGERPDEIESEARRLGLATDATYRVVVVGGEPVVGARPEWLGAAGSIQSAGRLAGGAAYLVECRDRAGEMNSPRAGAGSTAPCAASAPAFGVRGIPEAARQARFVFSLLENGALRGPVAQFDRPGDLHVYRLLYDLWGASATDRYLDETLGDLRRGDRRGELRNTLAALLAAGGSHAEAARRLGIHRNTLAYRLRQIDRALGRNLSDADVRVGLHLALLLEALPPADDRRAGSERGLAGASPNGRFDGR